MRENNSDFLKLRRTVTPGGKKYIKRRVPLVLDREGGDEGSAGGLVDKKYPKKCDFREDVGRMHREGSTGCRGYRKNTHSSKY